MQLVLKNFWPILVLHAFVDLVLFVSYRTLHRILNQSVPLRSPSPSLIHLWAHVLVAPSLSACASFMVMDAGILIVFVFLPLCAPHPQSECALSPCRILCHSFSSASSWQQVLIIDFCWSLQWPIEICSVLPFLHALCSMDVMDCIAEGPPSPLPNLQCYSFFGRECCLSRTVLYLKGMTLWHTSSEIMTGLDCMLLLVISLFAGN